MAPVAGSDGAFSAPAHRISWFDVDRPVAGTVFVRPAAAAEVPKHRREAADADD